MVNKISIIGSTGSIGTQALCVVKNLGIEVCGLACYSNIDLLEKQIREFRPKIVAVFKESSAKDLKVRVRDMKVKIVSGIDGLCEVASYQDSSLVLNAVVGMIGLYPTIAAIKEGKDVALANKETLVVGGELVIKLAKENGVKILPVDSEHSAIFQCLEGCRDKGDLKKLILTASGGPFFGKRIDELKNVKPFDALKHPNWSMGAKITIDSATLMNKGLEVIEAVWLFGVKQEDIEVIVHRESIIHSMIEYKDNSVIAQLGVPDMKIPIQYAITYPKRIESDVDRLDLTSIRNMSFYKPDTKTFKCLNICRDAITMGGTAPAIVNGANEVAVKLFLNQKISFLDIADIVEGALKKIKKTDIISCNDVINADKLAREFVADTV